MIIPFNFAEPNLARRGQLVAQQSYVFLRRRHEKPVDTCEIAIDLFLR